MNHLRNLRSLKNSKIHVMLQGNAGLLEGQLILSDVNESPIVLILPPHPKNKGTMNNKVVNVLYRNFQKLGFNTLKINYRGVGLSQGDFKNPECAIEDALTALDWLIHKCEKSKTKTPKIWIAGYSFGAWATLQCAMRRPEVSNFIIINLPVDKYPFNMLTPCPNGLVIHSSDDHVVSKEDAEGFCKELITQKGCVVQFQVIESNHYLTDKEEELYNINKEYIKSFL